MKLWRPRDPRAVSLIKLTLWAGLVTWMVFTLATGIAMARLAAVQLPKIIGVGPSGQIWTWIVPIWIVFTTLMLIWAIARFANKKLRSKEEEED